MFKILENGQVMTQEIGLTYELWTCLGMEYEYTKDEEGNIIETRKFNLQNEQYEVV